TRETQSEKHFQAPYQYHLSKWNVEASLFSATPMKSCVTAGPYRATKSASGDGMNHQDFLLLAGDSLDALTGCHVKRLRTGLSFVFGNHAVHFFHVGGFRIVFKKRGIATR